MQGLHKGISKGNISCKEEVIYNYIYYIIYTLPPYSVKNSSLIFFFPAWSLSHHTIGIFKCIYTFHGLLGIDNSENHTFILSIKYFNLFCMHIQRNTVMDVL